MTLKVGWFSTANGPGSLGMFQAALDAISDQTLDASIDYVFVNRTRGQTAPTDRFMDVAEASGIPVVALSSRDFRRANDGAPWTELRHLFDEAVLGLLAEFDTPDVGMQAGYMLYAPLLCERMLMLNQHPALPGGTVGRWQDAVRDTIRQGAHEAGAMVHIATADLDRGPVVSYCRYAVRGGAWDALWDECAARGVTVGGGGGDTESGDDPALEDEPLFREIRAAGVLRERPLVVRTLSAIAEGAISPEELREGRLGEPLDLTTAVEADVAAQRARDASQAE